MLDKIVNRLVSVKSIVTIILTVVFSALTIMGKLDQNFMMIYTVVISFYFGTQVQKSADKHETAEPQQAEPAGEQTVSIEELKEAVTADVLAQLHDEAKA